MKKNLIIALIALMLFACGRDTAFTIIGTTDLLDGRRVELHKQIDGDWIMVDSAQIIDGKYTFTGFVEKPTLVRMWIEAEWTQLVPIILERGTIKVFTDANWKSTITGTRNNNIRQSLLDVEFSAMQNIQEAWRAVSEAEEVGDMERAAYLIREEVNKYWKEWFELVVEFASNNINNPAGQAQLRFSQGQLELEHLQEILANANRRTLQIPEIAAIVERVEMLTRTAVGQPFVDLTMQDPNGNYISISDFVGNGYLMLDFTGTWCGPCRAGKPAMIETFNRFKDRGFNILGIWFEFSHEDWVSGMADLNMPDWPQMSDLQGIRSRGRDLYAIPYVPYSVLIDPNGIIIARGLHGEFLNEKLEELLGD